MPTINQVINNIEFLNSHMEKHGNCFLGIKVTDVVPDNCSNFQLSSLSTCEKIVLYFKHFFYQFIDCVMKSSDSAWNPVRKVEHVLNDQLSLIDQKVIDQASNLDLWQLQNRLVKFSELLSKPVSLITGLCGGAISSNANIQLLQAQVKRKIDLDDERREIEWKERKRQEQFDKEVYQEFNTVVKNLESIIPKLKSFPQVSESNWKIHQYLSDLEAIMKKMESYKDRKQIPHIMKHVLRMVIDQKLFDLFKRIIQICPESAKVDETVDYLASFVSDPFMFFLNNHFRVYPHDRHTNQLMEDILLAFLKFDPLDVANGRSRISQTLRHMNTDKGEFLCSILEKLLKEKAKTTMSHVRKVPEIENFPPGVPKIIEELIDTESIEGLIANINSEDMQNIFCGVIELHFSNKIDEELSTIDFFLRSGFDPSPLFNPSNPIRLTSDDLDLNAQVRARGGYRSLTLWRFLLESDVSVVKSGSHTSK